MSEYVIAYERGREDFLKQKLTINNIVNELDSFMSTILKRFILTFRERELPKLDLGTCSEGVCLDLHVENNHVRMSLSVRSGIYSISLIKMKYSIDRTTGEVKLCEKDINKEDIELIIDKESSIKRILKELAYELGKLEEYYKDQNHN